jgi:hypothetical protein
MRNKSKNYVCSLEVEIQVNNSNCKSIQHNLSRKRHYLSKDLKDTGFGLYFLFFNLRTTLFLQIKKKRFQNLQI